MNPALLTCEVEPLDIDGHMLSRAELQLCHHEGDVWNLRLSSGLNIQVHTHAHTHMYTHTHANTETGTVMV